MPAHRLARDDNKGWPSFASAIIHDRILKVARTITDLAEGEDIGKDHLLEALQGRTLDRSVWM